MKRLIFDLDDTLCTTQNGDYANAQPITEVVEKLKEYHRQGFTIVINTSRNMRTYQGNIGAINKNTLPIIIDWLDDMISRMMNYTQVNLWCALKGFMWMTKLFDPTNWLSYAEICQLLDLTP